MQESLCRMTSITLCVLVSTALSESRHAFWSTININSVDQCVFESLSQTLRSCSSNGRVRRFERRGCGFKSCQEFHFGVRRPRRRFGLLFEIRILSPHPKIQSAVKPAHSKNAEVM